MQRVDKWNTSPGGPLEMHVQTSSGDNGWQTSSGEHGGEPGSDHNSLMEEEHEQRGTAAQDDAAAAADSISEAKKREIGEKVTVDAVLVVGAVVGLECHEPVMGGGSKRTRLDDDDDSGGKALEDKTDTDVRLPAASAQPPPRLFPQGAFSASIKPEAPEAAGGAGGAVEGDLTATNVQTLTLDTADDSRPDDDLQDPSSAQDLLRQAMSTRQLQNKYEEVFGVPTKVHNKDWILGKISERVTLQVPDAKPPKEQPSTKSQKRAQGLGGRAAGDKGCEKPGRGLDGAGAAPRKNGGNATALGDIPAGQMRCSRNDGKNWRCSEMATAGHKHCTKHMRWSAGGRGVAGKQQGQGLGLGLGLGQNQSTAGVKRPRWLTAADTPGGGNQAGGAPPMGLPYGALPPPHPMPPGAPNPLVAAPLLSAAASALDELHNKEESESQRHLRQGLGGMMPPGFGFGGWPGAPHVAYIPGLSGPPVAQQMSFIPGVATYRPTPTKAPFAFDALITSAGVGDGHSSPGLSAAAAAAGTMAGPPLSTGVDCTVELIPMPGAGSSAHVPGGGGERAIKAAVSTVRSTLNLASLSSFDALHCSLASLVGAPPPAGGRHDPSALQIVYCDMSGAPAVLGGESWRVFLSRARSVHARLLVPIEETLKANDDGGGGFVPASFTQMSAPAPAPAPAPALVPAPALQGVFPPPFAEMQAQWATMGLDPNLMMAMMMYAATTSTGSYHNAAPSQ